MAEAHVKVTPSHVQPQSLAPNGKTTTTCQNERWQVNQQQLSKQNEFAAALGEEENFPSVSVCPLLIVSLGVGGQSGWRCFAAMQRERRWRLERHIYHCQNRLWRLWGDAVALRNPAVMFVMSSSLAQ